MYVADDSIQSIFILSLEMRLYTNFAISLQDSVGIPTWILCIEMYLQLKTIVSAKGTLIDNES